MSDYELCHPVSYQSESVMLCYKTNHRTLLHTVTKKQILQTFTECKIWDTPLRWAELHDIGSQHSHEDLWLERALEKTEGIVGKKIILLQKESKPLHKNMDEITHKYPADLNLSWYKIAIQDTKKDTILFRTFKNFCDTTIQRAPEQIDSHSIGWYIYSSRCKKPSKMKADITFWRRLRQILSS